jgi:pyruvate dehydrogenase E2 component (dihydrolipoamide acetyltransferase)
MIDYVVMPKLGLTMESGVVTKWVRQVGDSIKKGDVLLPVESDKAVVDVESEFTGILLKQYCAEGVTIPCGQKIAAIGAAGEKVEETESDQPAGPGKMAVAGPGNNREEKTIDIGGESSPVTGERRIASPRAKKFAKEHGIDITLVGKGSGENNRITEKDVRDYWEANAAAAEKVSPVARNIAEASDISLEGVKGSGPAGRIMKQDVLRAIEGQKAASSVTTGGAAGQKKPLSNMRATIARRLSESKRSIPHYYMSISVNMEALVRARTAYNMVHADAKVSMNAMIMKAVAVALMKHPEMNASWSDDGITYFPNADIALAVATHTGLITPVVRECNGKSILGIEKELVDLIERARGSALKPEEFSGSTCTISNLGMYGIEEFSR